MNKLIGYKPCKSDELYYHLESLVKQPDSPFYKLVVPEETGNQLAIYCYRIASYSDFCKPGALEARGIMYREFFDNKDRFLYATCVCRPPAKFFNWRENPFTDYTMEYILDNMESVWYKEDGSLISTYDYNSVKSKTRLSSDVAIASKQWLSKHGVRFDTNDITHNFELVGPDNRIVLDYSQENLVHLNSRNNVTGEWVDCTLPTKPNIATKDDLRNFKQQTGIEGYVVRMNDGQLIKFKTDWYLHLHRNKESVSNPKSLFALCINEQADDLKSLFQNDYQVIEHICRAEALVGKWANQTIGTSVCFHREHKDWDRKEYAITAKSKLRPIEFVITMMIYSGRINPDSDFKEFLLKNYDDFVIWNQEQ